MERISCAVIGYGWAGHRHTEAVFQSKWAELAAMVDVNPAARQQCAAKYHVPVFESVEEALEKTKIHTAIVATLPTTHARLCEALIRRGIHVLCEKPLSRDSLEIERLARLADETGVRLGVVFNQRYGYAVQTARKLLAEDDSPRQLITASMYQNFPKAPSGHFDSMYLLTDSCCHLLDLMTYLAGPVEDGIAVGTKNEHGILSNVAASLRFRNGCIGTMTHSIYGGALDTQHPFQQIDIHTSKARYSLENCNGRLTFYPHSSDARMVYEPSAFMRKDYDSTLTDACEDFLKAVALGEPLPASAQDAWNNMRIIERLGSSIVYGS